MKEISNPKSANAAGMIGNRLSEGLQNVFLFVVLAKPF
jgi:hypothetical protein